MPPTVNSGAVVYLLLVLVCMPAMGLWSWYRVKSGKPIPPKEKRYRALIVMQVWLIVVGWSVMQDNDLQLFSRGGPPLWGWVVAAGYMLIIAQRVKVGWRKIPEARKLRARRLLPENRVQWRYWIAISLLAGLSEELAFRGIAFALLVRLTHRSSVAVFACVVAFGLAHAMQGWRGVLGTSVIALVMHGVVYVTGGLYLPMAVHATYDLIVGFIALRSFSTETTAPLQQAQSAD